jgi:uncharacterized membrane protein
MNMAEEPVQQLVGPDEGAAKDAVLLVYILQAVGFFIGITWIAGAMVNYVKLDYARGTWLESHFRWQLRTFWFGLLWAVVGSLTFWILGLGFIVLGVNYVWLIYRVVKGWVYLNDRKPLYA